MDISDNKTPYPAPEYDDNVRKTIPYYETIHGEVIDLVKAAKPDVELWLDTGCGTGTMVNSALPHFSGTSFILSDPSENMLAQATKRLDGEDGNRVRFLDPMETQRLPEKVSQKPEVITAVLCHHYMDADNRRKATEACFSMLAKGGIYITIEIIRPSTDKGLAIGLKRWGSFQLSRGRSKSAVEEHLNRLDKKHFPITVNEHLNLLNGCGFESAEIFWHSQMQAGFYAIR
ncbi:MAG: class I SAM-dependent methyltransferase [Nitrospinota bacterium]